MEYWLWVRVCVSVCVSEGVRVWGCDSEWVSEWVSGWVGGWVGEWARNGVCMWMYVCVSVWVSEWVSEKLRTCGRVSYVMCMCVCVYVCMCVCVRMCLFEPSSVITVNQLMHYTHTHTHTHTRVPVGWSFVISSRAYFNSECKWLVAPAMMVLPFVSDIMR
jgi:hypothetical protein